MDQSGAIVGPLLTTVLMLYFGFTFRDIFLFSFIPGVIALLVILFFVKETVPKEGARWEFLSGIKSTLTSRYRQLLTIVAIFSLGAFNFSFILLNAELMGVTEALIPLVYAFLNVTHTIIGIPAGMLADRIGKEKVLEIGYFFFMGTCALLLLPINNIIFAYIIAGIFGLYFGVVETVQRAMVPQYASDGMRGTAYGIYYLIVGLSFFVSNAIVGWLWNSYGSFLASIYSISTTAMSLILMGFFLRDDSRKD